MQPKLENFTQSTPLQLRWIDLDPLSHVNNSVYFTYFEIGRSLFMLTASPSWDWRKNMFLIANIGANFIRELKIDAKNPKVWCRTAKMGRKSFDIEYIITSEHKGETVIHAQGQSTQVMFDMASRKTIEIPDWLREELLAYEVEGSVEV